MIQEGDETGLTNEIWTAPQKQVAEASSSVDQPSPPEPESGKKALDVSAVAAISFLSMTVVQRCVYRTFVGMN